MARLNAGAATPTTRSRTTQKSSSYNTDTDSDPGSPTPPADGSDKENQSVEPSAHSRKRRSSTTMSRQAEFSTDASKRRRVDQDRLLQRNQGAHQDELNSRGDRNFYDPDQDVGQIRSSRKQYRNLSSRLNDSRAEFLQSKSTGIENTLDEANRLFQDVKQTSVATIDSRLLVGVSDLANKKVKTLTLGDSSIGVDVDDFITKCISFMKRGDDQEERDITETQSSQRQRRRRRQADDDDDNDDPMNWSYLGTNACFLYNSRPCLSGFLLGPLSIQKKQRQATQRRARQTQVNSTQAARPTELGQEDFEKQESANLTVICGEIARLLDQTISRATQKVEREYDSYQPEQPSPEEIQAIITKHGLTDNGCLPLFNFCVNPKSFGQTVENMFYVSFLIKEGRVGLDFDGNGLPTLGTAKQKSVSQRQETQRNQAVFTLDFDMWRELVDSFNIGKSIIPHRVDEDWDDGTVLRLPTRENGDDDDDDDDGGGAGGGGGGGGSSNINSNDELDEL